MQATQDLAEAVNLNFFLFYFRLHQFYQIARLFDSRLIKQKSVLKTIDLFYSLSISLYFHLFSQILTLNILMILTDYPLKFFVHNQTVNLLAINFVYLDFRLSAEVQKRAISYF